MQVKENARERQRTEVLAGITPAFPSLVCVSLRTVLERLVTIADIAEKVDLVFAREERRADAMYWRISPALKRRQWMLDTTSR
jgi:hypothetical protein